MLVTDSKLTKVYEISLLYMLSFKVTCAELRMCMSHLIVCMSQLEGRKNPTRGCLSRINNEIKKKFVKVMELRNLTNQVSADPLMPHRFRSLSNSSEILAICTHILSWVDIHRDLFELSCGKQIVNRQMDGHISSPVSSQQSLGLCLVNPMLCIVQFKKNSD